MKRVIGIMVIFSVAYYSRANEMEQRPDDIFCKGFLQGAEIGADRCNLEDRINEVIENLRKTVQSFDPLEVAEYAFNPTTNIISGDLKITNLKLQGLSKFIKTEGCYNAIPPRVNLGLRLDKVALTTNYTGNINLLNLIDIYGTGHASITLTDFTITAVISVNVLTRKITKIVANVVLPATDAKITGLVNDEYMSDIISRQLSDTLTTLAKEEEERINNIVNEILKKIVDKLNEKFSEVSDNNGSTTTEKNCYNMFAAVKQAVPILTEKDFFMNWLSKIYFN